MSVYKHIPNMLTLLRIVLVLPFVLALWNEMYTLALALLLVAGITDGLDGFLARHFGWYSWFGSVADPVADKILLTSSFIVFGLMGHQPMWLIYLVVGRDLLILSGVITYWKLTGDFEGRPTFLGKTCTFYLIVHGLAVLVSLSVMKIPAPWIQLSNVLVASLCLCSALQYVYLGIQALRSPGKGD